MGASSGSRCPVWVDSGPFHQRLGRALAWEERAVAKWTNPRSSRRNSIGTGSRGIPLRGRTRSPEYQRPRSETYSWGLDGVISTMAQLGDLSTGRVRVGRTVGATEGAVERTRRY
jgi:hypothetical protein